MAAARRFTTTVAARFRFDDAAVISRTTIAAAKCCPPAAPQISAASICKCRVEYAAPFNIQNMQTVTRDVTPIQNVQPHQQNRLIARQTHLDIICKKTRIPVSIASGAVYTQNRCRRGRRFRVNSETVFTANVKFIAPRANCCVWCRYEREHRFRRRRRACRVRCTITHEPSVRAAYSSQNQLLTRQVQTFVFNYRQLPCHRCPQSAPLPPHVQLHSPFCRSSLTPFV